jgi:hypothetical protein
MKIVAVFLGTRTSLPAANPIHTKRRLALLYGDFPATPGDPNAAKSRGQQPERTRLRYGALE